MDELFKTSDVKTNHIENNEDVVVMGLMNDGTASYNIIEGVSVGETHTLDFSEFLQSSQKIINNLIYFEIFFEDVLCSKCECH